MTDSRSILMLFPGELDDLPPAMNAAIRLKRQGWDVHLAVMSADKRSLHLIEEHSVKAHLLSPVRYSDLSRTGRLIFKGRYFFLIREVIRRTNPAVIWLHGAHAMAYWILPPRVGSFIVCHCHELHDRDPLLGRIQSRVLNRADLFLSPEPHRSWMLKIQSGTKARFLTLPNFFPEAQRRECGDGEDAKETFVRNGGSPRCRRFFIYQGHFSRQRCLKELILAFRSLKEEEWGLLLLGKTNEDPYCRELAVAATGDARIVILERMPYPDHMRVTDGCHGGIMLYAPSSLNNFFCAPNKIYEYAASGLGVVAPDYPPMKAVARVHGFLATCDPSDPESIASAIHRIGKTEKPELESKARVFLSGIEDPEIAFGKINEYLTLGRV